MSSSEADGEPPAEDDDMYEVEFIHSAKRVGPDEWQYLVKWFGYDDLTEYTWEPEDNLESSNELLTSFWKDAGPEKKSNNTANKRVYSSKLWREAQTKDSIRNAQGKEMKGVDKEVSKKNSRAERDATDTSKSNKAGNSHVNAATNKSTTSRSSQPMSNSTASKTGSSDIKGKSNAGNPSSVTVKTVTVQKAIPMKPKGFLATSSTAPIANASKKRKASTDGRANSSKQITPAPKSKSKPPTQPRSRSNSLSSDNSLFNSHPSSPNTQKKRKLDDKSKPAGKIRKTPTSTSQPKKTHPNRIISRSSSEEIPLSVSNPAPAPTPASPPAPIHIPNPDNVKKRHRGVSGGLPNLETAQFGTSTKQNIAKRQPVFVALGRDQTKAYGVVPPISSIPAEKPLSSTPIELSSPVDENNDIVDNTIVDAPAPDSILGLSSTIPKKRPGALDILQASPSLSQSANTMTPKLAFARKRFWKGNLTSNTKGRHDPNIICDVALESATTIPNLEITASLEGSNEIHLTSTFLAGSALEFLFPAFLPGASFAKVVPGENGTELFSKFYQYLADGDMIATVKQNDSLPTLMLLVYPSTSAILCAVLNTPESLRDIPNALLIVSLQKRRPRAFPPVLPRSSEAKFESDKNFRQYGPYFRATKVLGMDRTILDQLAQRPFCIFTTTTLPGSFRSDRQQRAVVSGKGEEEDFDTLALRIALAHVQAKEVVLTEDKQQAVFIHSVVWDEALDHLPQLAHRGRRHEIDFYKYGSNKHSVQSPGVVGVYPMGGVITFTARAVAEDPNGFQKVVKAQTEHPQWSIYVMPNVVAVLETLALSSPEPEAPPESVVGFVELLGEIRQNNIDVTWCPLTTDPTLSNIAEWYLDQAAFEELHNDQTALVARCREHLDSSVEESKMTQINTHAIENMVNLEIVKDLRDLQRLPVINEEYRRFVMIASKSEAKDLAPKGCFGVEITTISDFQLYDRSRHQSTGGA